LNLQINKKIENNFSEITGNIGDISLLAYGLNLSDKLAAGNTKINIKNKVVNNKTTLEGELHITDKLAIQEGNELKKLYNNQLVSKIKDKISANSKIVFDQVKLEFLLQDKGLKIKSFIANNLLIGVTAKGSVNFKENSINIKGLLIPGYFINNLFGIGKIPIIGSVVNGLLTGGEGGGLFGIKYEYIKEPGQAEPIFKTYKLSAFVPVSIRSLFEEK
jgi:hypothetical protein